MKKQVIAALLIGCAAFGFAGCGQQTTTQQTTTQQTTTQQTVDTMGMTRAINIAYDNKFEPGTYVKFGQLHTLDFINGDEPEIILHDSIKIGNSYKLIYVHVSDKIVDQNTCESFIGKLKALQDKCHSQYINLTNVTLEIVRIEFDQFGSIDIYTK